MFATYYSPTQRLINKILLFTVVLFVLQIVMGLILPNSLEYFLSLSSMSIHKGWVWTLITYAFLHGGLWHLLLNLLFIFFIGQALALELSRKQFLFLYIASILFAGLSWLLLHLDRPGLLLGASGAGMGLLSYYCCLNPNQRISLLLFFIFPLTLRKKTLLLSVALFEILSFLSYELPGNSSIANSAHLGGILAGIICYFLINGTRNFSFLRMLKRPNEMRSYTNTKVKAPISYNVIISEHEDIKKEVDRILDKINTHGFASLTSEEKLILEKARHLLRK